MSSDSPADQYDCTARLLEETPDALVVSNLGVASYVLAGVADRPRNFYLWGSMGVTTPVGLGLAMAVDDPVTVLDGDGSMLMSLGVLATVAEVDPPNLTIVIWDNSRYMTTGGQSAPSVTTDFVGVAESMGLDAFAATTTEAFGDVYERAVDADGATLVVCSVSPVDPAERPPFDFAHIKHRFREAVGDNS